MSEEIEKIELEIKPASQEAVDAASSALTNIRNRSFSARHPELGKMVKCQVCNRRHRDSIKCEQKFKELWVEENLETGEKTTIYAVAMQEKGVEVPSQISAQQPTLKQMVGAASFKGKRLNPHPNRRNLQMVELVRSLLPDEFTQEDLEKARKKARRVLAGKFGRFGFLPPIWAKQKTAQAESV